MMTLSEICRAERLRLELGLNPLIFILTVHLALYQFVLQFSIYRSLLTISEEKWVEEVNNNLI